MRDTERLFPNSYDPACLDPACLETAGTHPPDSLTMRLTSFDEHSIRDQISGFVVLVLWMLWQASLVQAEERPGQPANLSSEQQIRIFETKVRPLLAEHCYECHGAEQQESDLRLDTTEGIMTGGHAGPAIVAGKPDGSLLLTAVRYLDSDLRMPPGGKLSREQIADLKTWIETGASLPGVDTVTWKTQSKDVDIEAGRNHWAFQPVAKHRPPIDREEVTTSHAIDAFLAKGWAETGLHPVPLASKAVLIRRATFDLIGLPPTPNEVEAFLADDSPFAFSHVIDRLLASPHYGERWGRRWLDVARYADSNGLDENVAHGNAWRYRDYVVDSLNGDKPYDAFLTEQLAGDLLDSGDDVKLRNERLVATGFLTLGPKVLAEKDEAKMRMDIIDEQLDTIGRSVLGLTLGCARCHSHKFDPISHSDYYGLAGIFQSTRTMESYETVAKWHENRIETPEQSERREEHEDAIASKEKEIADVIAKATGQLELPDDGTIEKLKPEELEQRFTDTVQSKLKTLRDELKKLQDSVPESPMAMGVAEATIVETPVHLRGSHLTLGDVVPRRFPEVLVSKVQTPLPDHRSGRLEFARWLTSGNHPLTARVIVNRVWRGHFGKGLVPTVDNFGIQGELPTHPELLDWLANQLVESGWSLKSLHRLIMLSDAYGRSSNDDVHNRTVDVDNRLYWRFDLQRLEAEAIRDGMLAISGELDAEMGGSLLGLKNREYVFNHTSQDKSTYDLARRSIYVPVIRNHLFDLFKLFDYTDASVLNGDRDSSTIAPQALFLMNSQIVTDLSLALADRVLRSDASVTGVADEATSPLARDSLARPLPIVESRIRHLYALAYGRMPTERESKQAKTFLNRMETLFVGQSDGAVEEVPPRRRAWQALCQSIMSSSEFVYVR